MKYSLFPSQQIRFSVSDRYDQRSILLAFTLSEIPFILLSSMLFVLPFYFMVGFANEAYKFWLYYLFITLNMGLFTFLGQVNEVVPTLLETNMLFCSIFCASHFQHFLSNLADDGITYEGQ